MARFIPCLVISLVAALHPWSAIAGAQAVPDSLKPITAAEQLATAGDTAGAVRVLKTAAEASSRNAPLWHAYGILLYAWTRPHWRQMPMPAGIPARIVAAESSLARAMVLAPDSARYAIDYARNLFNTNTTSLSAAQRAEYRAVAAAERTSDTAMMVRSAEHLGVLLWRKYEQDANRTDRPSQGDALYNEALEYFRFARIAAPDDERALRREAMALADRARWPELKTMARERIAKKPSQAWPWLALGLAEHRMESYPAAVAAFDTGFKLLNVQDRERLLSMHRILPRAVSSMLDTASDAFREKMIRSFWNIADPALLVPGNPAQSEFHARLVFAELLWTDDENPIQGAESDKGAVHISFGPPDYIIDGAWVYLPPVSRVFRFTQTWGYGTAELPPAMKDSLKVQRSFGYDFSNVPLVARALNLVELQIARFRAEGDSVDLFVASQLPVGALRHDLATEESQLRSGVFTIDEKGKVLTDKRSTVVVKQVPENAAILRTQYHRTDTSARVVRVELLEPDAQRVASGSEFLAGFSTSGFGVSDLILSPLISPPKNPDSSRWYDFNVQPALGSTYERNGRMSILWEVYGLSAVEGTSRFRVSIEINRITEKGVIATAVRLLGGIRGTNDGRNSRAVSYERQVRHREEVAESIQLDLSTAPVGRYELKLTITDLGSGKSASRTRAYEIITR